MTDEEKMVKEIEEIINETDYGKIAVEAVSLLEEAVEELENCYGKTELTIKIRGFLNS